MPVFRFAAVDGRQGAKIRLMHAIRKAFPPEDAADLFRQFCGRFRDILQGIIQLQFIPFESPHLVEREHVHAFHVAQARRMAGEFLNFFQIVRNAGYQHIPQPHGLAEGGQAVRKLQRGAQLPACQGAVPFRIPCLDIQQDQVRILQHFSVRIRAQMAGSVQTGMQSQLSAAFQHGTGKIRLKEGIPAGEGDAAARRPQKIPVAGYFLKDITRASGPAPPHVGGIRIMAVAAAQAAAGQEEDKADAGAVHGAAGFHGMNQAGDGAFSIRVMVLWKNLRHPFAVRVNGCGKCG